MPRPESGRLMDFCHGSHLQYSFFSTLSLRPVILNTLLCRHVTSTSDRKCDASIAITSCNHRVGVKRLFCVSNRPCSRSCVFILCVCVSEMASVRDAMKIFVGNVDDRTTQEELSELFEKYGTVVSCAVMKQYAFVHMRGSDRAMKAIEELNGRELHGKKMVVELSKPRPQNTWKIFVGNVGPGYDAAELRTLFEEYGKVIECDVVKGNGGEWTAGDRARRSRPERKETKMAARLLGK